MSVTLPIERRRLGRSELTIPRVALGCGNFGGVGSAPEFFGQGLAEDQALALMDAAWEAGITHFDTADAYGGGRSEQMIGAWMLSRGMRPMLTTKTFNPMDAGADSGLAPERVARQLDSSLERLGVEYVELYLAHEFDPSVALADTYQVLADAADATPASIAAVPPMLNTAASATRASRRRAPPSPLMNITEAPWSSD